MASRVRRVDPDPQTNTRLSPKATRYLIVQFASLPPPSSSANASRFASRHSIAAIVLRSIRMWAVISFSKCTDSAVNSPCFRAFRLPLGASRPLPSASLAIVRGSGAAKPLRRFDFGVGAGDADYADGCAPSVSGAIGTCRDDVNRSDNPLL